MSAPQVGAEPDARAKALALVADLAKRQVAMTSLQVQDLITRYPHAAPDLKHLLDTFTVDAARGLEQIDR